MGALTDPQKVKLVASLIYRPGEYPDAVIERLKRRYGPLDTHRFETSFDYTDYYEKEFGADLRRVMISFERLVHLKDAAKIKLFTNKIEEKSAVGGNRVINIDPGYVTEAKLVLLTTKDYSHRLYISDRIYAEVTLCFKEGSFCSWPWSYPDYASDEMVEYFNGVRARYVGQLRGK